MLLKDDVQQSDIHSHPSTYLWRYFPKVAECSDPVLVRTDAAACCCCCCCCVVDHKLWLHQVSAIAISTREDVGPRGSHCIQGDSSLEQ